MSCVTHLSSTMLPAMDDPMLVVEVMMMVMQETWVWECVEAVTEGHQLWLRPRRGCCHLLCQSQSQAQPAVMCPPSQTTTKQHHHTTPNTTLLSFSSLSSADR